MHLYLSEKEEFREKCKFEKKKELDSVCILCSVKVTALLCAEKIPSEY